MISVSEMWAGRVTSWSSTTGEYLGISANFSYPVTVVPCGAGDSAGIAVAEYISNRIGECRL
jgi:hypothetical protein